VSNNYLNLKEIDQEQALNLVKFFIKANKNIFLFSRRGIGKTEIIYQAAKECNLKVNYINLSVIERTDLSGYPNIFSKDEVITFKSPSFLPFLKEGESPDRILLFDEVDKAPPEVTSPLLEILQFNKINGRRINVGSCILTGNLPNERANSNQISSALLDRGAKYIMQFNFDKWLEWAKNNNVHDLIMGFLRSNTGFACGKTEDCNYASPSPRAWTLASEALIEAKDIKIADIETVTQIISGFVGDEAGMKFRIWYEYFRKFEPYTHSLIDFGDPKIDFHKLMPTEKVVFIITACYYAKQQLLKNKNSFNGLQNLCEFFDKNKVDKELIVLGLYNSFDFSDVAKYKLYTCNIFYQLFNELSSIIEIKNN
jgi:hypothetical protein